MALKLCINCEYYTRHGGSGYYVGKQLCLHPKTAITDPVDGEVIYQHPRVARELVNGACGPEAKLFAPKKEAFKIRRPPRVGYWERWKRFLFGERYVERG